MTALQTALFLPGIDDQVPDLASYDWIVVNLSGGKDSIAALYETVWAARDAGVLDRVVCVHADLGTAEWEGTRQLAAEHAAAYGLRFEVVARNGADLIDRIEERGMFPDAANRWCTSDFKRGPVRTLFTRLVAESHQAGHRGRVRILNVLGIRAEESPARRKLAAFSHEGAWTCPCEACTRRRRRVEDLHRRDLPVPRGTGPGWGASNTLRHVDTWYPVHSWSEAEVWLAGEHSGLRQHPAYAAGMPRLSCVFCVLASRSALVLAAQLNPELAARIAAVEARIGHRFRNDVSMAEIIAEAEATPGLSKAACWLG